MPPPEEHGAGDGWRWFSAWLEDGWFPVDSSGNELHDFVLIMEKHWGDPLRLAAFVTVKERDDGTIKIKARTDDVDELPKDWDSGLAAWTLAGWDLIQASGNRENGFGWLLVKGTVDVEEA